jgi:hypothetical protein
MNSNMYMNIVVTMENLIAGGNENQASISYQ